MQNELTDSDIFKIKRKNLFGFTRDRYRDLNGATVLIYFYSFFFPYYGWRKKPTHPPQNIHEYFQQVLKMQLILLPLLILVVSNIMVKKIEISSSIKNRYKAKILLKRRILGVLYIVVFKPFRVIVFFNSHKFNDVSENDTILVETTFLRRLLCYQKVEDRLA